MGATASNVPALAFVALLASTASMATDTLNVREGGHLILQPTHALYLCPVDCSMTCTVCSFRQLSVMVQHSARLKLNGFSLLQLSYIASIMEGPAAATCIATVNSVGNLGGLIGPFMIGEDEHHGACHDCKMSWCCYRPLLQQWSSTCTDLRGSFELFTG